MYTERAVEFIDRHKESPFFLYLAHSMPHVPIAVSEKYKDKSGTGIFGDLMLEIDDSIGEVMTALERNGLTDNTLVIFTSDNGPWLTFGNHAGSSGGLREGKGSAWEVEIGFPPPLSNLFGYDPRQRWISRNL
jgi:arylsulfatase A-like enzyme